ncbi:MAG: Nif3-like dinuclear metal center hexameric protein [Verrucomicrobiales bacterium]|nr:Nif3-like dinuclear metal center hexameric protein [Verrucomicrobiales bacterium]
MASAALADIVRYCTRRLRPDAFTDYDGAVNGLQFENRGRVSRIAAAVDASFTTVRMAVGAGADLLVVHHGLFWGRTVPWTGRRAELLRELVGHDLAVYSQHLPLDGHPTLGNAAQLARALGLRNLRPFFAGRGGEWLGVQSSLTRPMPRPELARRLAKVLGADPVVLPGGSDVCRRIGICTGGAGSELAQARREGVDTFITGEGPHWTLALAEDLGVNALYGGHYATETFGVKALAAELSARFRIPWLFLDHPSGL